MIGHEFSIRIPGITGMGLEALKKSIIFQAKKVGLDASCTSQGDSISIRLNGDDLKIIAYKEAIKCWVIDQEQSDESYGD